MLFSPLTLGELELPNRVVMAPLTRVRSGARRARTAGCRALPTAGLSRSDRQ